MNKIRSIVLHFILIFFVHNQGLLANALVSHQPQTMGSKENATLPSQQPYSSTPYPQSSLMVSLQPQVLTQELPRFIPSTPKTNIPSPSSSQFSKSGNIQSSDSSQLSSLCDKSDIYCELNSSLQTRIEITQKTTSGLTNNIDIIDLKETGSQVNPLQLELQTNTALQSREYDDYESATENLDYLEEYREYKDYLSKSSQTPEYHWCLLGLSGNMTIVRKRHAEFIKYLRMNVASLIHSSYENVIFNGITYSPEILVNISLDWNIAENNYKIMKKLAENNDTILDLSGTHYTVTSFRDSDSILTPKPIETRLNPREVEALIYMAVGASIAFVLSSSILFVVCHFIRKQELERDREKLLENPPKSSSSDNNLIYRRYRDPPKLIYSKAFTNDLNSCSTSQNYTPLDDNLFPVHLEDDFVPRFLQSESDGGNSEPSPPVQSMPNSAEVSSLIIEDARDQHYLGPLPDERTSLVQSFSPDLVNKKRRLTTTAPRPPSRNSSVSARPHSSAATLSYLSSPGCTLSLPAPHNVEQSFVPSSPPGHIDTPPQQVIDQHVRLVFQDLGLNSDVDYN